VAPDLSSIPVIQQILPWDLLQPSCDHCPNRHPDRLRDCRRQVRNAILGKGRTYSDIVLQEADPCIGERTFHSKSDAMREKGSGRKDQITSPQVDSGARDIIVTDSKLIEFKIENFNDHFTAVSTVEGRPAGAQRV
jgi:hypothetical protein